LPDGKASEPSPPKKRSANCPECERLWTVYTVVTRKYLDATLAQEALAGCGSIDKINVLEAEANELAQWRELARKAVRDHAAMHAGEKPEPPE
jgi:hypothetical protein